MHVGFVILAAAVTTAGDAPLHAEARHVQFLDVVGPNGPEQEAVAAEPRCAAVETRSLSEISLRLKSESGPPFDCFARQQEAKGQSLELGNVARCFQIRKGSR